MTARTNIKVAWLGFLTTAVISISSEVVAANFNPNPIYSNAGNYTTAIPVTGSNSGFDSTDIYYPIVPSSGTTLPVVLLLQGALVERDDYANYASQIAKYGFVVVVPDHIRTLVGPMSSFTGFFPDQHLINDVLNFMVDENQNTGSPLAGQIDFNTAGLLGHSFGGAVGLASIANICLPVLCNPTLGFSRPTALKAGIFYGANLRDQITGQFIPINNSGVPTGLIAGERDGVASELSTIVTYNNIQPDTKLLVTLQGANHYGITNEDSFRDPVRPTLDQTIATETIARWSALFLQAHLLDNQEAFNYVYRTGDSLDNNVMVTSSIPEPSSKLSIIALGGLGVLIILNSKINNRRQRRIKKQDFLHN
jgi:dienelactone hydrolase